MKPKQASHLQDILARIDGRGYKAYKDIQGHYDLNRFTLHIDHVQSDPFAPPSRMRIELNQQIAGFPEKFFNTKPRRIALEDFLARAFAIAAHKLSQSSGTGKSGLILIDRPGQEILERTSMRVDKDTVEARFTVGLPARGRKILARQAEKIFFALLPKIVENSLIYTNLNAQKLARHIQIAEDQEVLRAGLKEKNLVAFIGNGSILPRESGISDRPLPREKAVPFISPKELEVCFNLPNQGQVKGMGIPAGVTLIVGGGYHGKSTLLKAIERGVYNHIPDDGRELVVTVPDAMKIRAEDGRSVIKTDISPFISNLPGGQSTESFSTSNASGSTSQAANIVEALEAGSSLLLLDEDTSATNFMIRDGRMQMLVAKEFEPITPFVDRVRELLTRFSVSTILVLGGSGDYFDVADQVIMMQNYEALDVTKKAKEIADRYKNFRRQEQKKPLKEITQRILLKDSFKLGPRDKIKAKGLTTIIVGRQSIKLDFIEQLIHPSQTNAIAEIIRYMDRHYIDDKKTLSQVIDQVLNDISRQGLDVISSFHGQHPGNLALPRKQEILAAINRYRNLKVEQTKTPSSS
ncbi:ABC-ATPase domain-containing protein [Desulfohalobiaceae bacterium Ax17]|uniref:ABC-ATPase domain-containing protein n=1 Tax=Desulfovulcanus ferrireducens TaxID=2831190 RepID=UPI00207BA082|nr:ABC-ATPase domain-containing protein [Desulfovulcanus ferrireducens]MBT8763595.1 ABC-ATPase domain-containing protein [Desulfovulcanus ferrireducens]